MYCNNNVYSILDALQNNYFENRKLGHYNRKNVVFLLDHDCNLKSIRLLVVDEQLVCENLVIVVLTDGMTFFQS